MPHFRPIDGLSTTIEVLEYTLAELLTPGIAIEELTVAVEGLELSELGRRIGGEILAQIDPALAQEMAGPGLSPASIARLHRKLERHVLPTRLTELSVHEEGIHGWDPVTKKPIVGPAR